MRDVAGVVAMDRGARVAAGLTAKRKTAKREVACAIAEREAAATAATAAHAHTSRTVMVAMSGHGQ